MAKVDTKTVYTTVKMDDDRVVEFPGKRRILKEAFENKDGSLAVRLDFLNGETRTFTLPDSLISKFALHGAGQKLVDEVSGLTDVEDSIMAIDSLTERLSAGDWSVKRESSDMAGMSVLARALMELTSKTSAEIRKYLGERTHGEKVALRDNPKLAGIIAKLEANKKAKPSAVDTDALLEELA